MYDGTQVPICYLYGYPFVCLLRYMKICQDVCRYVFYLYPCMLLFKCIYISLSLSMFIHLHLDEWDSNTFGPTYLMLFLSVQLPHLFRSSLYEPTYRGIPTQTPHMLQQFAARSKAHTHTHTITYIGSINQHTEPCVQTQHRYHRPHTYVWHGNSSAPERLVLGR